MNMHTRRLSKVEPDIRDEIGILFIVGDPQIDIKNTKLRQMDVNARSLVPLAGLKVSISSYTYFCIHIIVHSLTRKIYLWYICMHA